MVRIAKKNHVKIHTNSPVQKICTHKKRVTGIQLDSGEVVDADIVISNADMWFTETHMLAREEQTYPEKYWETRKLAPSAYILYL